MGLLEYYLIAINIFSFLYFILYLFLLVHDKASIFDTLLTIISLLGGSLGIFVSILIFDRKSRKETMMSRVFVICVLVIQLILYIFFKGGFFKDFSFAVWEFFDANRWIIIYLIAVNIITLIAFGIDKLKAIYNRTRIRIVTLLGLSLIGGTVGGLIAMYVFRHKTRIDYFTIGLPIMLIMQVVVVFFLYNVLL